VRQFAAQINARLNVGELSALRFESNSIEALRGRWLDHHEQLLRSFAQTIMRYGTATDGL